MTFPAITITDSTPFDFRWSDYCHKENKTGLLEVYVNSSTADVFYGYVPQVKPVQFSQIFIGTTNVIKPDPLAAYVTGSESLASVVPGMVFSSVDDNSNDGNYVVAVERAKNMVIMRNAMTLNGTVDATFTCPAITNANGQPILQGTGKAFVADHANRFLEVPLRFVVASGQTATLRLSYHNL